MGVPEPISIHAPLAGCDFNLVTDCHSFFISIHTPLAGCDLRSAHQDSGTSYFNPRTPYGVRLTSGQTKAPEPTFQSTHPSRGATAGAELLAVPGLISIHAPLAGCDLACVLPWIYRALFQSTHPLRGATSRFCSEAWDSIISIHAPLAGCDLCETELHHAGQPISIHAPLAGCDLICSSSTGTRWAFQSTHPLRGATVIALQTPISPARFQSTHPLRGATVTAMAQES